MELMCACLQLLIHISVPDSPEEAALLLWVLAGGSPETVRPQLASSQGSGLTEIFIVSSEISSRLFPSLTAIPDDSPLRSN